MYKLLCFFAFSLFFYHPVQSQQDSLFVRYDTASIEIKKISEEDLNSYRNNPAFTYEEIQKPNTKWDNFKAWITNTLKQFFSWIFGVEKATSVLLIFFRIIPYLLLAILLFILIKFFTNINIRSPKNQQKNQSIVSLSEDENIIKNENIHVLIQQALDDKNYRLAIRYYYLLILKLMSEKEIISWELQKTNDDYLNEIKELKLKTAFKKTTHLYNYIWYGDFTINEPKYDKAIIAFDSLQKILKENA